MGNAGGAEHVAGIRDVHALDGQAVVTRLLIGQRVHHGLAELDVLVGGDGVQRLHLERVAQGLVAALDLHLDLVADVIVEHVLEREKLRNRLAVDRHEDVAGGQHAVGGRSGLHLIDHEHAGELRIRRAHARLGLCAQSQAAQLVVRGVLEHRLERAARHRLARIDEFERARDRRQWQIEARRRTGGAARVERNHAALDVDDGRARGAARGARCGLVIERVEVVVLAVAVFRGLAIQARESSGKDRELLAGIVADDANLAPDDGARRIKRQLRRPDEAQLRRIVVIDAEVVHGIAVDREELHFLAVLENRLRRDRTRGHHVAIGQDETALRVDHESGGLRGRVPFRVEGPSAVDLNGDHAGGDALERLRPVLGRADRRRCRYRQRRCAAATGGAASGGGSAGGGFSAGAAPMRTDNNKADRNKVLRSMPIL